MSVRLTHTNLNNIQYVDDYKTKFLKTPLETMNCVHSLRTVAE